MDTEIGPWFWFPIPIPNFGLTLGENKRGGDSKVPELINEEGEKNSRKSINMEGGKKIKINKRVSMFI